MSVTTEIFWHDHGRWLLANTRIATSRYVTRCREHPRSIRLKRLMPSWLGGILVSVWCRDCGRHLGNP